MTTVRLFKPSSVFSLNYKPHLLSLKKIMDTDSITDEQRFLQEIKRNSGIINKICYCYAKDSEEFRDLRQDVITNMWAYRESFRGDSSVSTWIYRLALNTCISALRKRKSKGEKVSIDSIAHLSAEDTDLPAMHREMHQLISSLSAEEKAIILLWLDDMSYDNIAAIVGCQRNTLATRLRRIKEKIVRLSNK